MPSIYKCFITSYYHIIEEVSGVFDNYNDEDDREISVSLIPQLSNNPFGMILHIYEECEELLKFGYIPFGDFNGQGSICIDTLDSDRIVWFDYEEYYKCKERREFEEISIELFSGLKDFLICFFEQKRYNFENHKFEE